jgi:hypothetical protein
MRKEPQPQTSDSRGRKQIISKAKMTSGSFIVLDTGAAGQKYFGRFAA